MSAAVGFDFDHTLGVDHHLERRAFAILAKRLGVSMDGNDPHVAAQIDGILAPFRRAEQTMEDMLAQFIETLPVEDFTDQRDPAYLAERYREICFELVDDVTAVEGARELVEALSADGIPVAILTNGWSPLQERKVAQALGPFPGPILVSDAIGAYKPSLSAFEQLLGALRCTTDDLWFVGDDPSTDIAGAAAFGVRTIWLSEDGHEYPSNLAPPDAHVRHLRDVAKIVRGA